jgi:hypothetical protein
MHCVVCRNELPDSRRKNAITCSPECTQKRKAYWFSKLDAKMCRYCYKPSTPEQRALFQQWRRRPQNAEEEELFRRWREDQLKTQTVETRRANKKAKQEEEPTEAESDGQKEEVESSHGSHG